MPSGAAHQIHRSQPGYQQTRRLPTQQPPERYHALRQRKVRAGYNREGGLFTQAAALEFGAMVFQNMFGALSFLKYRRDDDFVDRLSYFYTSSFLIMMAVLVSFKQFGGRPLECWVPAQFTNSWEAYAEMYCWAQNTYWVPMQNKVPTEFSAREELQISYYQWVPFFLLAQAVLFYIPCMLWRLMNDKSGIRLHDIISAACHKDSIEPDFRQRIVDSLSKHIEACLRYQHSSNTHTTYTLHRVFKCFNVRYYDSYVTTMYLITKVLYVLNILLNLLMINGFLQSDNPFSMYGYEVLSDLWNKRSWQDSGSFPRVTLCDFEVRVLGHLQRHTVQCVLVINIFNEKIFILLWMWFTLLLAVAVLDSLYWFSISLTDHDRLRFLMRHLELTGEHPETFRRERKTQVMHFLKSFIKVDGVFVLRMIAAHAGVMFCTELTEALWNRYLSQNRRVPGSQYGDSRDNHHSSDSSFAQSTEDKLKSGGGSGTERTQPTHTLGSALRYLWGCLSPQPSAVEHFDINIGQATDDAPPLLMETTTSAAFRTEGEAVQATAPIERQSSGTMSSAPFDVITNPIFGDVQSADTPPPTTQSVPKTNKTLSQSSMPPSSSAKTPGTTAADVHHRQPSSVTVNIGGCSELDPFAADKGTHV